MYLAKEAGRDRVSVFNEGLREAANSRLSVEADLRHALGREQLAVWHHADGSIWTADRFIDIAEDTGLILDIGDWVMRQACTQAAAWAIAHPDRRISLRVNASALQFAEAGLLPGIDEALTASGLDPQLLCIEITETTLLRQSSAASDILAGIRARGHHHRNHHERT